jgi:HNH endonuclease
MVPYLIYLGLITVSDEPWFARLISYAITGRDNAFRDGVRARDGRCVISGQFNAMAQYDRWDGFQSAHVFPLHLENLWVQFDYGRWITNMDGETGTTKINFIQNGLLMKSDMHTCFDQYLIGINPDVSI